MKINKIITILFLLIPVSIFANDDNYKMNKETVLEEIQKKIKQADLEDNLVNVQYRDGFVILTGDVKSIEDKLKFQQIALHTQDVIDVKNNIRVVSPSSKSIVTVD